MTTPLIDRQERARALSDSASTLIVEAGAGAGTGKTALMAGRLVRLLAGGQPPESIAAITFTELAAGELQQRVELFVDRIMAGDMPGEVAAGLSDEPSTAQREALRAARDRLNRVTCTTIHGFCKQLIGPYSVETGMDPGAEMIDPEEAELTYEELLRRWLRENLSDAQDAYTEDDVLGQMLLQDTEHALARIEEVAEELRRNRDAVVPPGVLTRADLADFEAAVDSFGGAVAGVGEPDCDQIAADLSALRDHLVTALDRGPDSRGVVACAGPPRIPAMKDRTTDFRQLRKKGVFVNAARAQGASKAEADRLYEAANESYDWADGALNAFLRKAAAALNARFVEALRGLLDRYAAYKRDAALLDFDDLLFAARDLLRDHPEVRDALAQRYRVVLVDEFQDTDPLQADILWRLTEGNPSKPAPAPWKERVPEAGRLFLVGDPKQSIYRFRGADVSAYLTARETLEGGAGECLSIRANFRSRSGLLDWINASFYTSLSAEDQPGFEPLAPTRHDTDSETRVAALDTAVEASDPDKLPTVDDIRRAEAASVADLSRRLIGSYEVFDQRAENGTRLCRPGDIALIAPVGTSLWIYESALEQAGLPIATQAGKGIFRRQEILDLIAVARALADGRDTLALGALLRGPLVGLTEECILDCVAALPRDPERPDQIPTLTLNADPSSLPDPTARRTLEVLRGLRIRARRATPFELMAEAVEELRVRPILEQRHPRAAERALSNVDLFLELTRHYAVRGLKAFALDMRRRWEESASQAEGRPDAQQEAVQVITMHSAKGLEWPIVIPVNAMGEPRGEQGSQLRRADRTLHLHLSKTAPRTEAYETAKQTNEDEATAERVRLWYVTCTRAKQLLVFPRAGAKSSPGAWINLPGLDLGALPAFDIDPLDDGLPVAPEPEPNHQDATVFAAEAKRVAAAHPAIRRCSPSRHEGPVVPPSTHTVVAEDQAPSAAGPASILGSTTRGVVLHKLLEEVLTGQTGEDALPARARELLGELGVAPAATAAEGPEPTEIGRTASRGLACSEVAVLRAGLVPEYPVATSTIGEGEETITTGVADAVVLDGAKQPETVVDWKSDVAAEPGQRETYREQMRDYLTALRAQAGLIVYVTEGTVEMVAPA